MRTILNCLAAASIVAAAPLSAQENAARRLGAIVAVATDEYAKAVDGRGMLVAPAELEEARSFLADARGVAQRLAGPQSAQVRALLDTLLVAVTSRRTPADVEALRSRLERALGDDARLELPTRRADLAAGAAHYAANCASCHGVTGLGDGPAARGMVPAPPAIGDATVAGDLSPAQMFRIVSIGIPGTAMAGWSTVLDADARWDIVHHLNVLRGRALAARGASLLQGRCRGCVDGDGLAAAGLPAELSSTEWQVERSDVQMVAALHDAAALAGAAPLPASDARAVVAHARSWPSVRPPHEVATTAPEASARQVLALLDEALAAAAVGRTAEAGDKAFDAYLAFEPLETRARAAEPAAVAAMEARFAEFKGAVRTGDVAVARAARDAVMAGLPRMVELARPPEGWWTPFLQAFLIVVREGFEAILVIGAVLAFLAKTGNQGHARRVWQGVGAALAASAATAVVLATVLRSLPASRELVEGGTMLLAVAVLFSVSYWLISKADAARWQSFIREKVTEALRAGGGRALVLVGFLAVYREGAETALFFQALFSAPQAQGWALGGGIALGFVALVGIYLAFHRFGMRLPMKPFFQVTSGLLYLMAFVFAGKGVRELQEGNALPLTPLRGWPQVEPLGIFPSRETLLAQGILLLALAYAIWRTVSARPAVPDEARRAGPVEDAEIPPTDGTDHVHANLEGRLAELAAKATLLQERVRVLEEELARERAARR